MYIINLQEGRVGFALYRERIPTAHTIYRLVLMERCKSAPNRLGFCTESRPHTPAPDQIAPLGPGKSGRPHHSSSNTSVSCEMPNAVGKLVQHLMSVHRLIHLMYFLVCITCVFRENFISPISVISILSQKFLLISFRYIRYSHAMTVSST